MALNVLLYNVPTKQGHYLGRGANVTISAMITYI
jgi:hypothetical protein